jgi:HAD superfamily hydrolase (TIGR01549 family)
MQREPVLKEVRAVCFDVGNVLCGLHGGRVSAILAQFGFKVSPDEFAVAELSGRDRINEMVREAAGLQVINLDHVRSYFRRIFETLGIARDAWARIEAELLRESDRENLWNLCMPDVFPVLTELKRRGYPMGVVSNSDGRIAELMSSSGIAPFLSFIIDSSIVGIEKPDPRIFRMALDRFALPPGQVVFVGDIYEVDVMGSRAVGMQSVLIDPRGNLKGYDCPVIRRLAELPDLLA